MSYKRKRQNERNNKQLKSEHISSLSNLQQCSICNRRFTEDRLIDHQRTCQISRHNYHYNSQFHRWEGLNYRINSSRSLKKPVMHWKEKHQQFQDIIKGESNSIHNSIEVLNDRPYQCSKCQRKFATENGMIKHQKGCTGNRRMGTHKR